MSDEKILNPEEIEALIHGVDQGAVNVEAAPVPRDVRPYDFVSQMRLAQSHVPVLDTITERFCRQFRGTLSGLLRRNVDVKLHPVETTTLAEYLQPLTTPTSFNIFRLKPWQQHATLVIQAKLISSIVEVFFGGSGRPLKTDFSEFTATENRIVQLLINGALKDLQESWSSVLPTEAELLNAEINPHHIAICEPGELTLITRLEIALETGGGEFHLVLPRALVEPLRSASNSETASESRKIDQRWANTLREEINDAEIELTTVLGRSSLVLAELLNLKPGDVIPCDFTGKITVLAEQLPLFRGSFGISRGQQAVKVEERCRRPKQF
jgi:flagellar motor switch protein FliM